MFAVKGSWDDDEFAEKLNRELFPKKKKKKMTEEKKGKKRKITENENEENMKKKKKNELNELNGGNKDEMKEIEKLSRRQKKRKDRKCEGKIPQSKKLKQIAERTGSDAAKEEDNEGKKKKKKKKKCKNKFLPSEEKNEEKVEEIEGKTKKENIQEKSVKKDNAILKKYSKVQVKEVVEARKLKGEAKQEIMSREIKKKKRNKKRKLKAKEVEAVENLFSEEIDAAKKSEKVKTKVVQMKTAKNIEAEGLQSALKEESKEVKKSCVKMPFNPEVLRKKLDAAKGEKMHEIHTDEGRNDLYLKMKKRLSAGSFRYLNEQLYTIPGNEAFDLFVDDPQSFELYHHGYQSQVSKWPLNPVDLMIEYLRKKPADLNVADFGCGEAKIAQSVKNPVQSFDLVALNDHVTACDIADVPLLDESVDVGVFCLSLMGTNCSEYLAEANRVLVNGGKLLVAEVKSRFEKIGSFVRKMRKIGFNLLDTKDDNKMFVWLEFEKVSESPSKEALPNIDLLPCIYKKR